jgi:hypothetical protein
MAATASQDERERLKKSSLSFLSGEKGMGIRDLSKKRYYKDYEEIFVIYRFSVIILFLFRITKI